MHIDSEVKASHETGFSIDMKHYETTPAGLRPIDWITVGYFLWLSLAIVCGANRPSSWPIYILAHGGLCGILIRASRQRERLSSPARIIFDWYPIWGIAFVFLELHPLFQIVVPRWFDEFFLSVDVAMFGVFPSSTLERFYSRPINEIVVFGYFSYYFIPFLIAVPLYRRGNRVGFHETSTSIFMTTLICLVLFLLFPTQGPRQYFGHLRTAPLDGYLFTWIQRNLITVGGLIGGAFPSSHCAVAMASLVQAYRHRSRTFWALLILVPLLSFATVHGWYHYAIDVFAGWAIGLGAVWVAARLYRRNARTPLER